MSGNVIFVARNFTKVTPTEPFFIVFIDFMYCLYQLLLLFGSVSTESLPSRSRC